MLDKSRLGLVDHWLSHVHDVARTHSARLARIEEPHARFARLCELNVIEQVRNVVQSIVVQDSWAKGRDISIHGLIYGLDDGLLRDLGISVDGPARLESAYSNAVAGTDGDLKAPGPRLG